MFLLRNEKNYIQTILNTPSYLELWYTKPWKGFVIQESKQEVRKGYPLVKMARQHWDLPIYHKCSRVAAFYKMRHTLKCLSIGTPKIINFPFVSNGKFMVIMCLNIQAHHNEAVLCLNFGTPENNEFSIWNKWKIYCF